MTRLPLPQLPTLPSLPGERSGRRRLSSVQKEAIAKQLGEEPSGGISKAFNFLDVPGAVARGTIANLAAPRESSFSEVFSPLLHPLSSQNRVSGRDLGRRLDLMDDKNDTWGNFLGGLALEAAFDPLTYTGVGALTKGGKAAAAAGKLAPTLGQRVAKGQASLLSAQLPFTNRSKEILGAGRIGTRAAEGLTSANQAIKASAPGRAVRQLFDPRVGGEFEKGAQAAQEMAYRQRKVSEPAARAATHDAMKGFQDLADAYHDSFGKPLGKNAEESFEALQKTIRLTAEFQGDVARASREIAGSVPSPAMTERIGSLTREWGRLKDDLHKSIETLGGQTRWLGSDLGHFPRSISKETAKEFPTPLRVLPTQHGYMLGRTDAIRYVPAEIVNRMLRDGDLFGDDAVDHLTSKYSSYVQGPKHAKELAKWLRAHKHLHRKGVDLFNVNAVDDLTRYMHGGHKVRAALEAIHDLFAESIDPAGVPVAQAFEELGLTDEALQHFTQKTKLKNAAINPEAISAAKTLIDPLANPKRMNQLTEWIDDLTRWFKTHFYVPFPASWERNFHSGQFLNYAALVRTPGDHKEYLQAFKEAAKLRNQPNDPIYRELYANRLIEHMIDDVELGLGKTEFDLAPGRVRDIPKEAWHRAQLQPPRGVGRALAKFPVGRQVQQGFQAAINTGDAMLRQVEFLNRVAPYLYLRRKDWDPTPAAEKVKELQIDYSDLSPFEKQYVKRVVPFYTFSRKIAAPIGKTILQRPGGVHTQVMRATERAREDDARTPEWISESTSLPWELPFMKPPVGTNRFLTGIGLAHEDPARFLGDNPVREGLSRVTPPLKFLIETGTGHSLFRNQPLSDLDPNIGRLASNIRELATGEPAQPGHATPIGAQFIGRGPARAIEHVANYLPSSRYLSTARTLTDPRKMQEIGGVPVPAGSLANALTGLRLTDVSPARQELELRRRAQEEMERMGGRAFSVHFIPEDVIRTLPLERQLAARRFNQLQAIRQ